ncbi:MAG: hypothetical protein AVDCRST_MAG71-1821, partial [uncultured Lysobacter sp.]
CSESVRRTYARHCRQACFGVESLRHRTAWAWHFWTQVAPAPSTISAST